jgi:hypothetical protein
MAKLLSIFNNAAKRQQSLTAQEAWQRRKRK